MFIYIYIYKCLYIYVCRHMYVYKYIYIYTYTHINTIHAYIYSKYFCGTYMLQPIIQNFGKVYLVNRYLSFNRSEIVRDLYSNNKYIEKLDKIQYIRSLNEFNVYVPSYPDILLCANYGSDCAGMYLSTRPCTCTCKYMNMLNKFTYIYIYIYIYI
jgi:hypothetical protein